jgi:hypothetical protein
MFVGIFANANEPKIHDNELKIKSVVQATNANNPDRKDVSGLVFKTKEFICTDGQPCEKKVFTNMDGNLVFRSGRKKSDEVFNKVKEWLGVESISEVWSTRGGSSEFPGELNFAYKGDITFTYEDYSGGTSPVTYNDVIIAQGRTTGEAKNYWYVFEAKTPDSSFHNDVSLKLPNGVFCAGPYDKILFVNNRSADKSKPMRVRNHGASEFNFYMHACSDG